MLRHLCVAGIVLAGASALPAAASPCLARAGDQTAPSGGPLTLATVLANVRQASPELLAAGLEVRARTAEAAQAGRWTNPSLTVEIENFAGGGEYYGFDQAETTLAVEQTLRLGGKRQLGEQAARASAALGEAECAVLLREAELEAALLYAELVAAVEAEALSAEAAELGEDLLAISDRRVEAGEAAPPERARARAEAARLKADAAGAASLIEQSRYALASIWGGDGEAIGLPVSGLQSGTDTDTGPAVSHPRLDAARAAESLGTRIEALERAQILPDLDVSAGIRRYEATGEQALVAGISVPLPIFDRNRDAADAARYRAEAARAGTRGVEARLRAQQQAAVARLRAAEIRVSLLNEEAVPAASQAYEAALQGYRIGRFDLDQTINARAALVATRLDLIAAELERNKASLNLRSLIGAAPFDGGQ